MVGRALHVDPRSSGAWSARPYRMLKRGLDKAQVDNPSLPATLEPKP